MFSKIKEHWSVHEHMCQSPLCIPIQHKEQRDEKGKEHIFCCHLSKFSGQILIICGQRSLKWIKIPAETSKMTTKVKTTGVFALDEHIPHKSSGIQRNATQPLLKQHAFLLASFGDQHKFARQSLQVNGAHSFPQSELRRSTNIDRLG